MAWWRHQMETFSALLAICAGNSPVSEITLEQTMVAGDLRRYRAHYDVPVMERGHYRHVWKPGYSCSCICIAWGTIVVPNSRFHGKYVVHFKFHVIVYKRGFATRKTWTCTCTKGPANVMSSKCAFVVVLFTGAYTSHVANFTCSQQVHVMQLREHFSKRWKQKLKK